MLIKTVFTQQFCYHAVQSSQQTEIINQPVVVQPGIVNRSQFESGNPAVDGDLSLFVDTLSAVDKTFTLLIFEELFQFGNLSVGSDGGVPDKGCKTVLNFGNTFFSH